MFNVWWTKTMRIRITSSAGSNSASRVGLLAQLRAGERVVTDAEGRAAFKTHDKETAKVHMIVVEWEKKHPFPPEAVQSALVRVLQEMAKSASPEPNSDAEQ